MVSGDSTRGLGGFIAEKSAHSIPLRIEFMAQNCPPHN
jgi:hypothetical protein